jgi:tetratricopeptide (TPR) repeat protein
MVMKALEKDRRRRYETANDFAADVMRYLTGQAVEAHPPSARYRLTKFVRRNRSVVIPAAVLTLMAVAGLSIGMAAVTRERDEARAQRQRADARFRLAYRVVSRLRNVYPSLRSDAGPEGTARLQRSVKDDLVRYYSQLIKANEDDPEISYELVDSYYYLSMLYRADDERRHRAFFQALSAYERAAKDRPDDTQVLNALALHYSRLATRYLGGEPERREATYRRALDLYERVARTHPDRVDDWVMIYYVATRCGDWLRGQGRSAEAEQLDRRILALFDRPEVDHDWFVKAEEQPAFGLIFLSELLVRCGQPVRAMPFLERARPHVVFAETYGAYSAALMNLCLALASDDDPAVVDRAVPLAREEVKFTSESDAQRWFLLGLALERTGDRQGANDAVRRGIELSGDSTAPLNTLAWTLVSDPRLSKRLPRWTVELARKTTERAPKFGSYWNTLGVALYRVGDWEDAIAALEKSEALEPGKYVAGNGFFLAMAHWQRGEKEQARQ